MRSQRNWRTALIAVALILVVAVPAVAATITGSADIKALYGQQSVMAQEKVLAAFGPRVAGSDAERAAADYISRQMTGFGLDVAIQEFTISYFEELMAPVLEQKQPNAVAYVPDSDFATMTYSGPGDVTAQLQAVDLLMPPTGGSTSGCEASDFVGFVPGNIALIQRGTSTFATKAAYAEAAGAVGVIIFNEGNTPERSDLLYGTLGVPGVSIPVVGTTYALGEELYELLLAGPVQVRLRVDALSEERTSQNVIGTKRGTDPSPGIVYIGGHYDSVSLAPGANDNASGTAATLEAAKVLASKGHKTKATLKFIAFGAEEIGLDGSYAYVVENYDEVFTKGIGMINLDMIGVGDVLQIGNIGYDDGGGPQLKAYTMQKATAMGLPWEDFAADENSDHTYFEQVGIPSVFITELPDPNYHTPEDSFDKIQPSVLEANGELATAVMYDWAKNPVLRAKKAAHLKEIHVHHDKVLAPR